MGNDAYSIENFIAAEQKLLDMSPYLRMKQKLQKDGWIHLIGNLWTKDSFIKSLKEHRGYVFKE